MYVLHGNKVIFIVIVIVIVTILSYALPPSWLKVVDLAKKNICVELAKYLLGYTLFLFTACTQKQQHLGVHSLSPNNKLIKCMMFVILVLFLYGFAVSVD